MTDGFHAERAENEGQHASQKKPDQNGRVREVEGAGLRTLSHFTGKLCKEDHCRETGRTDRIPFCHGFCRIADCIKRIRNVTHLFAKMRHFGDTASVVRDRSERINGNHDTGHRQHRYGRHRNAVKPA